MDCKYVLVWNRQSGEKHLHFHASTPEEAELRAAQIIRGEQEDEVGRGLPLTYFVDGILYRGFKEFDGAELVGHQENQTSNTKKENVVGGIYDGKL